MATLPALRQQIPTAARRRLAALVTVSSSLVSSGCLMASTSSFFLTVFVPWVPSADIDEYLKRVCQVLFQVLVRGCLCLHWLEIFAEWFWEDTQLFRCKPESHLLSASLPSFVLR